MIAIRRLPCRRPFARVVGYVVASTWLTFVFCQNPLSVHGLPFFEYDRPTSYLYSHENYDLNTVSLIRTPVLFHMLGREQPANGLSFRPKGVWANATPNDMRRIDVQMAQDPEDPREYFVYKSSFALQGFLWGCYARLFDLAPDSFERSIRIASSVFSALVFSAIVLWFAVNLHWACFPTALLLLPMVVGLVLPAPNMYRTLWAVAIPFTVSLYTYRHNQALHLATIFAALVLNFLFSFEFASNIAGATAIPALYFGILRGRRAMVLARNISKYAAVAVVAVLVAYGLLALRIEGFTGGDGSGHLLGRVENWLAFDHGPREVDLWAGLLKIGGATGLTLFGPVALPNAAVALLGVGLMSWILTRPMFASPLGAKLRAWTLTTLFAFVVSTSWTILLFDSVAFHPRFAPFLFAFPWLLCMTGVLGLLAAYWVWSRRNTLPSNRGESDTQASPGSHLMIGR